MTHGQMAEAAHGTAATRAAAHALDAVYADDEPMTSASATAAEAFAVACELAELRTALVNCTQALIRTSGGSGGARDPHQQRDPQQQQQQ